MAKDDFMEFDETKFDPGHITEQNLTKEMHDDFIDYAMSVIVARALPDVRDGLKPVQRRILYAMNEMNNTPDKPYKKCARIVGETMGKYHPHGDSSIYGALVYMAQTWNMREILIDGHGNFGSMDGDGAAAMRYTEARMSKLSVEMIRDLEKETVDMSPNYDNEDLEPNVLPARFPNLLVNGSMGIAVGMATNVAPHNLGETIDGVIAVMNNPEIEPGELMKYIKGPDFPTGGYIIGRSAIRRSFETGKGTIVMRARTEIDTLPNGKPRIIVTEIPYMVNKASMVERIAQLARDKQIEGITDLRDESNMSGVRVVMELRKDVQPEVLLNQLYKLTPLQSNLNVNNVVLFNNVPRLSSMKEMIQGYIDHQIDVVVRRTKYDLKKAQDRAHILEGLRIAMDHIDEVIHMIRSSKKDEAGLSQDLCDAFGLSMIQAKAILAMQLRRLSGLERDKIENEYQQLLLTIEDLKDILANHDRVLQIIRDDLTEIDQKYGDERRTEISDASVDMEDEDLIPVEDVIITLTESGYIKRQLVDTYRAQNRGGRGIKSLTLNEEDSIDTMISMSTHDFLLLFTDKGRVYRLKGYNVPSGSRTSKGIPIVNLMTLEKGEKVNVLVAVPKDDESETLLFVTKNGIVKRTSVSEFENINRNGKIAISLKPDDELRFVKLTTGQDEVIISGSNGKAVRFNEDQVRIMGRSASGVLGFNCDGSEVVGAALSSEGDTVLVVSENGYGKRSKFEDYRLTSRGKKGVSTINITEKTGKLMCMRSVTGKEDAMIVASDGIMIRVALENVGIYGRNTQGVRLINLNGDAKVMRMTLVDHEAPEAESEENIEE